MPGADDSVMLLLIRTAVLTAITIAAAIPTFIQGERRSDCRTRCRGRAARAGDVLIHVASVALARRFYWSLVFAGEVASPIRAAGFPSWHSMRSARLFAIVNS